MLVVYLDRLNQFGRDHANARKSLATWKATVEEATWKNRRDVLNDFPQAKMIANSRARFEILHNLYRLIAILTTRAKSSKFVSLVRIMNTTVLIQQPSKRTI